jgi:hypothetical protein
LKNDVHALKALITLVFSIAIPILKEAKKDGFQWPDLLSFIGSEDFKESFATIINEIKDLPAEVKDIDLEEAFQLIGLSVEKTKDLILSIKSLKGE